MDSKGRATDNICIERFWRSAKCERVYLNQYAGINELRDDVSDYIVFYNNKRFHEAISYKKPMAFYYDNLLETMETIPLDPSNKFPVQERSRCSVM